MTNVERNVKGENLTRRRFLHEAGLKVLGAVSTTAALWNFDLSVLADVQSPLEKQRVLESPPSSKQTQNDRSKEDFNAMVEGRLSAFIAGYQFMGDDQKSAIRKNLGFFASNPQLLTYYTEKRLKIQRPIVRPNQPHFLIADGDEMFMWIVGDPCAKTSASCLYWKDGQATVVLRKPEAGWNPTFPLDESTCNVDLNQQIAWHPSMGLVLTLQDDKIIGQYRPDGADYKIEEVPDEIYYYPYRPAPLLHRFHDRKPFYDRYNTRSFMQPATYFDPPLPLNPNPHQETSQEKLMAQAAFNRMTNKLFQQTQAYPGWINYEQFIQYRDSGKDANIDSFMIFNNKRGEPVFFLTQNPGQPGVREIVVAAQKAHDRLKTIAPELVLSNAMIDFTYRDEKDPDFIHVRYGEAVFVDSSYSPEQPQKAQYLDKNLNHDDPAVEDATMDLMFYLLEEAFLAKNNDGAPKQAQKFAADWMSRNRRVFEKLPSFNSFTYLTKLDNYRKLSEEHAQFVKRFNFHVPFEIEPF